MSTLTSTPTEHGAPPATRPAFAAIPFRRVVAVELRKTFDTRSGSWLVASIAISALVATGAVILFAPDPELTYATFATAIGFPIALILPVIALLSVTAEWSQRTGLTTFTFVPRRGRVVGAKAVVAVGIGVASMLLAAAVGAVGTLLGTAITGTDAVWDVSVADFSMIVLGNVLGLLIGFMLGVLLRSSAGALVGYFVYTFVLPTLGLVLAASQEWFRDVQPWVDLTYATNVLFAGVPDATQWAHIAVSGLVWLVLPLAVGLRLVLRSEVK